MSLRRADAQAHSPGEASAMGAPPTSAKADRSTSVGVWLMPASIKRFSSIQSDETVDASRMRPLYASGR